ARDAVRQSAHAEGRERGAAVARVAQAPAPRARPHRPRELLVRALCVVLLSALLCGCSTVRFVYDNAEAYLRWRLGSDLDVRGAMEEELDERIGAFMAWHRA